MQAQAILSDTNLEQIVQQILYSRKISRHAQQQLMRATLAKDKLNHTDQNLINRVFDALQRGLIRVVD